MKNRLEEPLRIMNDFMYDPEKMKAEFAKIDVVSLQRFKNYLKNDEDSTTFSSILKIVNDVLQSKMSAISESFRKMNEDEGGAGVGYSGGTAMVSQSSLGGLGNVVAAQPGVIPGTAGSPGSGDEPKSIGVPFTAIGGARLAQKIPAMGFSPDRRKKKGMSHGAMTGKPSRLRGFKGGPSQVSDLRNLAAAKTNKVNDMKPKKVMSFSDFSVDKLSKVTHVKEGKIHELITKAAKGNINKLHEEERESIMKHVAGKLSNFGAKSSGEKIKAELFTIEYSGNKFAVSIGDKKSHTFPLGSIGNMCEFIKDEVKKLKVKKLEVTESKIYEGAIKNVMQNLQDMNIDLAEDLLIKKNLGLGETELGMLAQFIANRADSMIEEADLEPVTGDELTIKIMNKVKFDQVVKAVNDILFDKN